MRIFFVLLLSLVFFSCEDSTTTPKDSFTLSGVVSYTGTSGSGGVVVSLYKEVVINDTLQQIMDEYPNIGVPLTPKLMFDKNEQDPVKVTETRSSGEWSFSDIKAGNYVVVLNKEHAFEFIHGVIVNEDLDIGSKTLKEAIVFENGTVIGEDLVIEANSNVYIQGVVKVSEFGSLTVKEGVNVAFSDSLYGEDGYDKGTLIVKNNLKMTGNKDNFIKLFGESTNETESWNAVKVEEGDADLSYILSLNSRGGVVLYKSESIITNSFFLNNKQGTSFVENALNSKCSNSVFIGNGIGFKGYMSEASVISDRSLFYGNGTGCDISGESSSFVSNSLFDSNNIGITTYQNFDGEVSNCEFRNNGFGAFLHGSDYAENTSKTTFSYCNFKNNSDWNINIEPRDYYINAMADINNCNIEGEKLIYIYGWIARPNKHDIDFKNNYFFGLKDSVEIEERIFDKEDVDAGAKNYTGKVKFMPIKPEYIYDAGIL
ncbi:MAG: hypothetical protein CSA15_10825 [Candidatus Delongbacteria bacterium]|nr:MAG: hypothetical protein CSA15_10825 [Candidatus Delongbacteria bacterium]